MNRKTVMTGISLFSFVLLYVTAFTQCKDEDEVIRGFQPEPDYIYNVGHRGTGVNSGNNLYPENTIISFQQAFNEGADAVELDVLLTSDGITVVTHDEYMGVTTNCPYYLCEKTLEEISGCQVSSKSEGGYSEQVPTLEAALRSNKSNGLTDIEIKIFSACQSQYDPNDLTAAIPIAEKVVQLVQELKMTDKVFVTSFNLKALQKIEELAPFIYTGYLYSFSSDAIRIATDNALDAIAPRSNLVTNQLVEDAKAAGLGVFPWTVNDQSTIQSLMDMQVTGIITDEPDVLASLLLQ